jgi:hypothetical protein
MSTVDRFSRNTEMDKVFPLASIKSLPRLASDHTPLIWDASLKETPKVREMVARERRQNHHCSFTR